MIKRILIGLAILVAFVVIVALQPSEFRIVRSALISAPAPAVFAQVNDFHNWEAWSPWATLDPAAKATFEGALEGTGAIFRWAGNSEVGEGNMTITESRPSDLIRIKLEFLKPFAATNHAEFTFNPVGNQTAVTWIMEGQNNFIAKAVCLFMNMDKMVGGQFEKGLASMKSVVEATSKNSVALRRAVEEP
jgi:Polyketide cyclase / dehydrase and lipid transport